MFASVPSAVVVGAEGHPVTVEVHVGDGLPGFHVVGLPDTTVREARDRVRAAVSSAGLGWPDTKITVNLAPSRQRKSGSGLDLAIAVGVVVAAGLVPAEAVSRLAFIGELGLDGSVRAVPGVAPMVGVLGASDVVVPVGSIAEASVAALGRVRAVDHLDDVLAALTGAAPWPEHPAQPPPAAPEPEPDLADVRGQSLARRALELAAAGGHHCLFVGPPGAGKTMLAARLPGLLPSLSREQSLETTMVHSAAGVPLPPGGLVIRPPYRAPHHTSSQVAIIGGGSHSLRPGEISIATGGVLFFDELPEFAPSVIETLRQPLEDGQVLVSRAAINAVLPARFQLVAAMNPCPCGGGQPGVCECGEHRAQKYRRRVSGPLLDRFDLRLRVDRPAVDELLDIEPGESSAAVAVRVAAARAAAIERQGCLNAHLGAGALDRLAPLDADARALLRHEIELGRLSARGYHRVRRVALTIADLEPFTSGSSGAAPEAVGEGHVALALELRAAFRPPTVGRAA